MAALVVTGLDPATQNGQTRGNAPSTQKTNEVCLMSLLVDLKVSKTEEDVKDAYVRAIGLKKYSKNLVDIQTKEIWFEAKEAGTSTVAMFAQLLVYIKIAHDKGEHLPPFLAVIDREKAALMETTNALTARPAPTAASYSCSSCSASCTCLSCTC